MVVCYSRNLFRKTGVDMDNLIKKAGNDNWRKKTAGFFPFFANLAETSRLVRIAEKYRELGGKAVFFSHGGGYEYLATEAGFEIFRVEPLYSPEEIDELWKYDRLEKFGDPFSVSWLTEHVLKEEQAYADCGVSMVVTGFNIPCSLSARKAGLPLVWIIPGTALPAYYQAGLATYPDTFENRMTKWLPARWKDWATNWYMLRTRMGTRSLNRVARKWNLPTFSNPLEMWIGEYTLVSDLQEALNIPPPYDYPKENYIGPLLGNLNIPLEKEVADHLARPGPSLYFSMGSSGNKDIYRQVLSALARTRYNVVAVYTTILAENELPSVGGNILLKKFVPAETVNKMVDMAVLHGGQGTFYTAAYSGRPVVGIPMQFEQQYNIDILVRNGSAIRISKRNFQERNLMRAIETIGKHYERYRNSAEELAERLPVVDGAERGSRRLKEIQNEHIGG